MSRKYNLHVRDDMWEYWQKETPEKFTEDGLCRPVLVKLAKRHPGETRIEVGDMVLIKNVNFRVARRIGMFAVAVLNYSRSPGDKRYDAHSLQWSRRLEDVREYRGEAYLYKKCDPGASGQRGPAYWAATDGTPEPLTSS